MKHPVIYRLAIYGIIVGLCLVIALLLSLMLEAPFSSRNMRDSYYNGCNIGYHGMLTVSSVDRCRDLANAYEDTLDDLDKQMESLNDQSR